VTVGQAIRDRFPALDQQINGHPLVYLDNGATTLKPDCVIEAIGSVYARDCANVHRGVHTLSQRATVRQEQARSTAQRFLGAAHDRECIFVRGTTEGINLVAHTWGRTNLGPGDEVLITAMEHHSGIVPWQIVCQATGATLKVAAIDDDGALDMDDYGRKLSERTKMVSAVHVSNALGTVNPVAEMIHAAHDVGAVVLLDGAQAAPHQPVDVVALDVDFYVFSGHKVYGPTGIGILYGKEALLDAMPPWEGGGDMIRTVTFEKTTYAPIPSKFEAGTPNIAGAIGLGAALDFLLDIGLDAISQYEAGLLDYAIERLDGIDGLRRIGTAKNRAGLVGFVLDWAHPHDVGTILDHEGVAIRAGHHCAQPVMDHFGVPATARASFGVYNTTDDVDRLVAALGTVREIFAP
jgi:cysteine desulfurase/selenocysteine lyase